MKVLASTLFEKVSSIKCPRGGWLQVAAIRRQLLTMLHVREFSEEAEWVDPCCPLVLPAVACSECFAVGALDVARAATQPRAWHCGACGAPYATPALEAALMERLQAAVVAAAV